MTTIVNGVEITPNVTETIDEIQSLPGVVDELADIVNFLLYEIDNDGQEAQVLNLIKTLNLVGCWLKKIATADNH